VKILIAAASKHGATAQIATAIADELRVAGAEVDVHEPEQVTDLAGYDATILGSAVYMGRWMPTARALLARSEVQLRTMPVWLFSSGPLSDSLQPRDGGEAVAETATRIGARGSAVFAGQLSRERLHVAERAVTFLVRARYGDYREWAAIRAWARSIAAELTGAAAVPLERIADPPAP